MDEDAPTARSDGERSYYDATPDSSPRPQHSAYAPDYAAQAPEYDPALGNDYDPVFDRYYAFDPNYGAFGDSYDSGYAFVDAGDSGYAFDDAGHPYDAHGGFGEYREYALSDVEVEEIAAGLALSLRGLSREDAVDVLLWLEDGCNDGAWRPLDEWHPD